MTEFIAEVSTNHNGSLERAKDLIKACAEAGFDAVKFQYLDIDRMFRPEVLAQRPDIRDRRQYNFIPAWLPIIKAVCREYNVGFYITCYRAKQVEQVTPFVDAIKVSSYDLLNRPLLEAVGKAGGPVYLSTGMANKVEIDRAIDLIVNPYLNIRLTLLHCVSQYPVRPSHCNLSRIEYLRDTYGIATGLSDHSGKPAIIYRAIHWRSASIELHIDLDDLRGAEQGDWVWPVSLAEQTISFVRLGFKSDGLSTFDPEQNELLERSWRADEDGMRPLKEIRL